MICKIKFHFKTRCNEIQMYYTSSNFLHEGVKIYKMHEVSGSIHNRLRVLRAVVVKKKKNKNMFLLNEC